MQKLITSFILALNITGCFGIQRDNINTEADMSIEALEAKCGRWQDYCIEENSQICMARVNQYCDRHFAIIQNHRNGDLEDVAARQQNFSQAMQNLGNRSGTSANCTSQVIGNQVYTHCN